MAAFDSSSLKAVEIRLDGLLIELPPERTSFAGIRSYLESLALQQQRILCTMSVDGEPVSLSQAGFCSKTFTRIEAETMSLEEVPLQLIRAAFQQGAAARSQILSAIELVLINSTAQARELWWEIAPALKEPLLTLSLLPEKVSDSASGSASLTQLRKWQLQQLASVIQEVDHASRFEDPVMLSDALESRALPWIEKLLESLNLWHETLAADSRSVCRGA